MLPEDTAGISADHVYQLAGYLQEAAPQAFDSLGRMLWGQPAVLATVSGVLLLHLLRPVADRSGVAAAATPAVAAPVTAAAAPRR